MAEGRKNVLKIETTDNEFVLKLIDFLNDTEVEEGSTVLTVEDYDNQPVTLMER